MPATHTPDGGAADDGVDGALRGRHAVHAVQNLVDPPQGDQLVHPDLVYNCTDLGTGAPTLSRNSASVHDSDRRIRMCGFGARWPPPAEASTAFRNMTDDVVEGLREPQRAAAEAQLATALREPRLGRSFTLGFPRPSHEAGLPLLRPFLPCFRLNSERRSFNPATSLPYSANCTFSAVFFATPTNLPSHPSINQFSPLTTSSGPKTPYETSAVLPTLQVPFGYRQLLLD